MLNITSVAILNLRRVISVSLRIVLEGNYFFDFTNINNVSSPGRTLNSSGANSFPAYFSSKSNENHDNVSQNISEISSMNCFMGVTLF